ncbi:MAG TPA: hypothetical protein VFW24_11590 [Acidimicrobiales bacterium]|nr:hypothetical protein [Acidimicrobiales bacterium]
MRRTRRSPGAVAHRTARIRLRVSPAQARRCFGLLRSAGDVWAGLIDLNAVRFRWAGPPIFDYPSLCRELAGADVGELWATAARSVLRRYSEACFTTAQRKKAGEAARYPRRRRGLMPARWYSGTFRLEGRGLALSVARGCPPLEVRLGRDLPYPPESVRSVSLVVDAGLHGDGRRGSDNKANVV